MPRNRTDSGGDLAAYLRRRIRAFGPLTVAEYMAEALGNPGWGYYRTRDPIGAAGDFITAPEVSQMFGELIGLWCADAWRKLGAPSPARLVEIGPGRGTLMRDALRAVRTLPAFRGSVDVHLVETSPVLRARQREMLPGVDATWHDRFLHVPEGPVVAVANELFDALPIHQFERTLRGWRERLVDADGDGGRFRFVLGPVTAAFSVAPEELRRAPLGSVIEVSPARVDLMRDIAERVIRGPGAALVIDCGHLETRPRDTLQAVAAHCGHEALESPGEADLCTHVDFAVLRRTATECGAEVWGPVPQGEFLESLGIRVRAARLKETATPEQRGEIDGALERLTGPGEMGILFKALAITALGTPAPGGFGADDR